MGCSLWACKESDMTQHVRAHACSDCRLVGCNVLWASLIAQLAMNLPAMQETLVQLLGQEEPLEKGKATHSSILGLPLWLSW